MVKKINWGITIKMMRAATLPKIYTQQFTRQTQVKPQLLPGLFSRITNQRTLITSKPINSSRSTLRLPQANSAPSVRTYKFPMGPMCQVFQTGDEPFELMWPGMLLALVSVAGLNLVQEIQTEADNHVDDLTQAALKTQLEDLKLKLAYCEIEKELERSLKEVDKIINNEGLPSLKVFISYAIPVDQNKKAEMFQRVEKLGEHLKMAGITAILDIQEINQSRGPVEFMDRIKGSDAMIVVGTRLYLKKSQKMYIAETVPNKEKCDWEEFAHGVGYELCLAWKKNKETEHKNFVVPIIFEEGCQARSDVFPTEENNPKYHFAKVFEDVMAIRLRNKDEYYENMLDLVQQVVCNRMKNDEDGQKNRIQNEVKKVKNKFAAKLNSINAKTRVQDAKVERWNSLKSQIKVFLEALTITTILNHRSPGTIWMQMPVLHLILLLRDPSKALDDFIRITPGVDIDVKNFNGRTALHMVAAMGKLEAGKVLINNGADILALDANQQNTLHRAIANNQLGMVEFLIEQAKEKFQKQPEKFSKFLNQPDIAGNTPTHLAAYSECAGVEILEALVREKNVCATRINAHGSTPLDLCSNASTMLAGNKSQVLQRLRKDFFGSQFPDENISLANIQVENKLELTLMRNRWLLFQHDGSSKKMMPLHHAIKDQQLWKVDLFIQKTSSQLEAEKLVNAKDAHGRGALHYAVAVPQEFLEGSRNKEQSLKIVETLIKKGADKNALTNTSSTPLHWAVSFGDIDFIKIVKTEANLNAKNSEGRTAVHYSVLNHHHKALEELLKDPKTKAWEPDIYGETPLHIAAQIGDEPMCKMLVSFLEKKGKKAATKIENLDGRTPHELAEANGHKRIILGVLAA